MPSSRMTGIRLTFGHTYQTCLGYVCGSRARSILLWKESPKERLSHSLLLLLICPLVKLLLQKYSCEQWSHQTPCKGSKNAADHTKGELWTGREEGRRASTVSPAHRNLWLNRLHLNRPQPLGLCLVFLNQPYEQLPTDYVLKRGGRKHLKEENYTYTYLSLKAFEGLECKVLTQPRKISTDGTGWGWYFHF